MLSTFSQNVILQQAFETAVRVNTKSLKERNSMVHFAIKFKLLVDRFTPFFTKCSKSIEKMIHQKKNRGH